MQHPCPVFCRSGSDWLVVACSLQHKLAITLTGEGAWLSVLPPAQHDAKLATATLLQTVAIMTLAMIAKALLNALHAAEP